MTRRAGAGSRPAYYGEMAQGALGLRAHSGWAALVAIEGTFDYPHVLERQRFVMADPEITGSKPLHHAAAELPLRFAEAVV